MRTNAGADFQSRVMGGDVVGETGTATATSATSLTNTGASWGTTQYVGHIVVAGSSPIVYGVILSHTATILTIDKWYTVASPGGAAASTPSATVTYAILPGGNPAFWMALSTDATAPAATDTTLTSELTGSGLQRVQATYGHTAGASTYTLSKTYTSSDATARTISKIGVFNASSGGNLVFESLTTNPPVMQSGDQVTFTETINL